MGCEVNSLAIQYIDMSGPTKCRSCKVPLRAINEPDYPLRLACPKCGSEPKNAHLGTYLVEIPMMSEESVVDFITTRKDQILEAMESGEAPLGEPSFLCNYCSYRESCSEAPK
jgi:hypothetical protein